MIVSLGFLSLGWIPLNGELNQILIFEVVFLIFKVVNLFLFYRISFLVRYHLVLELWFVLVLVFFLLLKLSLQLLVFHHGKAWKSYSFRSYRHE